MGQARPDADPNLTRRQAENLRSKIVNKAHRYVDILSRHLEGSLELKSTQVKAAQVLLSKVLPDEQRIEQVGTDTPAMTPAEVDKVLAEVFH